METDCSNTRDPGRATRAQARTHAYSHAPPRVAHCRLLPDFPAPNTVPPGRDRGFLWPRAEITLPHLLKHTHSDPILHPEGAGNHSREALAAPLQMTTFPVA